MYKHNIHSIIIHVVNKLFVNGSPGRQHVFSVCACSMWCFKCGVIFNGAQSGAILMRVNVHFILFIHLMHSTLGNFPDSIFILWRVFRGTHAHYIYVPLSEKRVRLSVPSTIFNVFYLNNHKFVLNCFYPKHEKKEKTEHMKWTWTLAHVRHSFSSVT